MKTTIASMAMLVSATSAVAMPNSQVPGDRVPTKKIYCLQTAYINSDKSTELYNCDFSEMNKRNGVELKENGCAENQTAIQTYQELPLSSCMPPAPAQL